MLALALFALLFASIFAEDDTGCTDVNNIVTCCLDLEISFIELDGCVELIIDFDMLDVELEFLLNGVVLFDETFGFDTPPELCTEIWGIDICIAFEDFVYDEWSLSGCIDLLVGPEDIQLGCFNVDDE